MMAFAWLIERHKRMVRRTVKRETAFGARGAGE
jgi:hypothetical protein